MAPEERMKAEAYAKINLALVVGEKREDGLHEVATVLQRIGIADTVELEPAAGLEVEGFPEDTLVRSALERLAQAEGAEPRWRVRIEKRIPVAAGLGGGSADAAAALTLANETLSAVELHEVAASVGADVPFFLEPGPKLAQGAGESLRALELPQDYTVLVALPSDGRKDSTAEVYRRFDERDGAPGFADRRAALLEALDRGGLAGLPPNDLAGSPLAEELRRLGAFRADVSGAGPAVYGLFESAPEAEEAARSLVGAEVWVTKPVW